MIVASRLLCRRAHCCTQIIQTLVTDIEPDSKVRVAMNEINAAVRQRAAALEKAEAGARTAFKHVIKLGVCGAASVSVALCQVKDVHLQCTRTGHVPRIS